MFKKPNEILALNLFVVLMHFSLPVMANESSPPNILAKTAPIHSFTLTQAIEFALSNNPDLQIASERIAQAEANLGVALSVFYPEISAKVGYEDSNNPSHVFSMLVSQRQYGANQNINNPGYYQDFRPEITGKLSLFRGGQDYQNSKAAELGISAAEYEHSSIRNALIQAVTASYYAYLGALEAHKV
ncbi:MAG: TolC family protein, partial [Methylobacter sp.]|nr:TolC family protein [Methylobacter sp.]